MKNISLRPCPAGGVEASGNRKEVVYRDSCYTQVIRIPQIANYHKRASPGASLAPEIRTEQFGRRGLASAFLESQQAVLALVGNVVEQKRLL